MNRLRHYVLPDRYEVAGVSLITLLVIGFSSSHQLISYYGLTDSTDQIGSGTSSAINHGLRHLDAFQQTDTVVTLLLWMVVGCLLLALSIALGRLSQYVATARKVGLGQQYVRPVAFDRRRFWQRTGLDFAGFISLGLLFTATLYGCMVYAWPVAFSYIHRFNLPASWRGVCAIAAGSVILFCSLVVLYTILKLFIRSCSIFKD